LGFSKRIFSLFNVIAKTIFPLTQHFSVLSELQALYAGGDKTHYSTIPAFQYSNWGEALDLNLHYD
jgi:hypothetical protein